MGVSSSASELTEAVPHRPLLAPWYRLLGDDDRLLLEHAQSVVVLEGGAVRALLPALLPLLDGTRTVEELVARLGEAVRPAVDSALATLAAHRLLVEGPAAPAAVRDAAHAAAAAYGIAPTVAAERLETAVVAVVGQSPAAANVGRLLQAARLGEVRCAEWPDPGNVRLAIVAPTGGELDQLAEWNRRALLTGTRWLLLRPYDGRFASVGPLVVPGESACYECMLLRRAANLEYGDDLPRLEATPQSVTVDAAFDAFVAALAAHVAVRWVVGRDATLPGVLHTVELRPSLTVSEHVVLRVPRCPACSPNQVAAPLPWHGAEPA